MVAIWSFMTIRGDKHKGFNQFINLAIHIFHIVANSAGCERLFSLLGIIHTKLRNRLGHNKAHKIAALKMHLRKGQAEEGLLASRTRKRKFGVAVGDMAETAEQDDAVIDEAQGLQTVVASLTRDSKDDEDAVTVSASDSAEATSQASTTAPSSVYPFFSQKESLTLADIFDYKAPHSGLGFYWKGGEVNLKREAEVYEGLNAPEEDVSAPATSNTTPSTTTSNIIVID